MKKIYILVLVIVFTGIGYYAKKHNIPAYIHSWIKNSHDEVDTDFVKKFFKKNENNFDFFTEEIRQFVNQNSVSRRIKDDFNENDTNKTLRMMIDYYKKKGPPPMLSCSARTLVMQSILNIMDYESRIVTFLSEDTGSHTFLEVLNPKTNKWFVEDPDYNISYKFNNKTEKISLGDIIINPVNNYNPCRKEKCGWFLAKGLKIYTGAAFYFNFDHTPVILINQHKFKANTKLKWDKKKRNLVEYVNEIWGTNISEALTIVIN